MSKNEQWVTQKQFAEKLKISQTAVWNAVKNGRIKAKKRGRNVLIEFHSQRLAFLNSSTIDLNAARKRRLKKKVKVNGKKAGHKEAETEQSLDDITDLHEARLKFEIAKAKKMQLEVQEAEGKLVEMNKIEKLLLDIATSVQKSILAIPARVGPLAAAERDPHKCVMLLNKELKYSLQVMSDGFKTSRVKE